MIVVVNPLPIEGVSQIDDVDDLDDADVVVLIGLEHLQEVLERDVITDVLIVTVVHTSEIYDCIEVVEWAWLVACQTRIVLACPNEVWALPYVAEARLSGLHVAAGLKLLSTRAAGLRSRSLLLTSLEVMVKKLKSRTGLLTVGVTS